MLMNVQTIHVTQMPDVLTIQGPMNVNAMMVTLGMDSLARVRMLKFFCKNVFVEFYQIVIFWYFLDINECLNNPCNANANCTDNTGSFECRCKVGFTGDGFTCTSIIKFCLFVHFCLILAISLYFLLSTIL